MSRPNRQDIAPADLDRFAKLVEARLGIRADAGDLRTALAERVAATGAASVSTYVERLDNHQAAKEWSALANHLTVPETYFFRNTGHWKAFAEYAIPRIVGKQGAQSPSLRIWSAECSTGEEPYTIAMVLAEMGLSKLVGAGSILATDLLEEPLVTAKKAAYRHNSFRGMSKERTAGEAGQTFSVVADQVGKLADRAKQAAKEVRGIVDEIQKSTSTTIMATEDGLKAADRGMASQDKASEGMARVAEEIRSTLDAAREIEVSSKQQTTAAEQVREGLDQVVNAAKESEASAKQTLGTADLLVTTAANLDNI